MNSLLLASSLIKLNFPKDSDSNPLSIKLCFLSALPNDDLTFTLAVTDDLSSYRNYSSA